MNLELENQCIEQEENEEYEETESFSVPEKNTDGETTKQLSPPEVNTTFNSETEPKSGGKKNCTNPNLIDLNVPSEELISCVPNATVWEVNDAEVRELVPAETAVEETLAQDSYNLFVS
ncbi:hypothetical protein ACET3Z_021187 [Daucus carota]